MGVAFDALVQIFIYSGPMVCPILQCWPTPPPPHQHLNLMYLAACVIGFRRLILSFSASYIKSGKSYMFFS
jgi:hypothetical protein